MLKMQRISLLIGLILIGNVFCEFYEISRDNDLEASASLLRPNLLGATLFGPKTFGIGSSNLGRFGPFGYGNLGSMRMGKIGPLHYGHIGGIHANSFLGAANPNADEEESTGGTGTTSGNQYHEVVGSAMEQNYQGIDDQQNFVGNAMQQNYQGIDGPNNIGMQQNYQGVDDQQNFVGNAMEQNYQGIDGPNNIGMQQNYQGMDDQQNFVGMQQNFQGIDGPNNIGMQQNYQGIDDQQNFVGMEQNWQGIDGPNNGMQHNYQGIDDQQNFVGMEQNWQGFNPNDQEAWQLGLQPQMPENSRAFLNDGLFGVKGDKLDKFEKIPPKPAPPPKFPKHPPPKFTPPPPRPPPIIPPPIFKPPPPPTYDYYGGYGSNSHSHGSSSSSQSGTYRGFDGGHRHHGHHHHGHHHHGHNHHGHNHHRGNGINKFDIFGGFNKFRSNVQQFEVAAPQGYYQSYDQLPQSYEINYAMPLPTTYYHQPNIILTEHHPQSRQSSARSSVDDVITGLEDIGFDFEFRDLIENVFLTPYLGLLDPNDLDDDTLLFL